MCLWGNTQQSSENNIQNSNEAAMAMTTFNADALTIEEESTTMLIAKRKRDQERLFAVVVTFALLSGLFIYGVVYRTYLVDKNQKKYRIKLFGGSLISRS